MSTIIKKISDKNPTGTDQKYEDAYLVIESEIDKIKNASNIGEVDWKSINEVSTQILEEESKDLKIASYWLYAQWKLSSWDGLDIALPVYTELISTYKIKLFPKSTKVKLRILEWLHENLTIAILKEIGQLDEANFNGLLHALEILESTIIEAFEQEDLKIFASLIRKLKKYNEERISREKLNEKVVPVVEKEVDIPVKSEEQISVESYKLDEHKRELKNRLSTIENTEFLLEMTQLIGFNKFKESFLKDEKLKREEFPSNEKVNYLITLEEKKDYLELLKMYISKYPCWLEGQYLLIKKEFKKEKAEQYKVFLNTLKYNLISFIESNRENIYDCTVENYIILGEGLKKWVNLENKYVEISNTNSKYEEIFQKSLTLVKTKSKEEAVTMLDDIKKESKTSEETFLWALKQVYLALNIDDRNMAVALLYDLNTEINNFNLEKWKPNLAIEVYVLLLKPSINKILKTEMKELIYGKLCRLSPQEAMKVGFL